MIRLALSGRSMVAVCALSSVLGLVVAACGSSSSNQYPQGPGGNDSGTVNGDGNVNHLPDGGMLGGDGGMVSGDSYIDPDAFWSMDPPPMWCGPDGGGMMPPPPGGTPDCPSDKNREGCPCPTTGMTASCWPGLRANRGLGVCKDGTTTCVMKDEFTKIWGPCMGYVLPTPNAKGAAACKCFSGGQWKIDNLSPCFVNYGAQSYAVSTYQDATGMAQCPGAPGGPPPMPQPGSNWSTDSLKVDCAGHFKLCFTLKAGMAASPMPTDCTVVQVCSEADYTMANMVQTFPPLPAWVGMDPVCATQFANTGGYGEMSVIGQSVRCDAVDDGMGGPMVFNRVQYCPLSCSMNPTGPGCANCMQGGSGMF
jgi:hypothetical protein